MKKAILKTLLVLGGYLILSILLTPLASAEEVRYTIDDQLSRMTFFVDSTLHEVEGTVNSFSGEISFDPQTLRAAAGAWVKIPVAGLDTRNERRDRSMRVMFDSEVFQDIRFEAYAFQCSDETVKQTKFACDISGMLTIRDIVQNIKVPVTVVRQGDMFKVEGEIMIKRDNFRLKTPSVLGFIRVNQEVTVRFNTLWKPEKS